MVGGARVTKLPVTQVRPKRPKTKSAHPAKHFFMVQYWRIGQIASLASLVLMMLTLAGTYYAYIEWRIPNPYVGIALLFFTILGIVMFIGYLWDRKFRMWNEQNIVAVRRTPYSREKMNPKEVCSWKHLFIPILIDQGDLEDAEFWTNWINHELESDPELKRDVQRLEEMMK